MRQLNTSYYKKMSAYQKDFGFGGFVGYGGGVPSLLVMKELSRGMSVIGYSDFLTNLFTRSSTIRKYFLFILSFRKLFPISFAASSGTSIYLSSTLLIRASVNPICVPNRSKSMRHGWPVLSNTLHSPDNYVRLFQLIDIEVQEW